MKIRMPGRRTPGEAVRILRGAVIADSEVTVTNQAGSRMTVAPRRHAESRLPLRQWVKRMTQARDVEISNGDN